jgi:hypothetical protein
MVIFLMWTKIRIHTGKNNYLGGCLDLNSGLCTFLQVLYHLSHASIPIFNIFFNWPIVIVHTCEVHVTFQYMCTMCNYQSRVIGISVTSDISHFFVLEASKVLSNTYFEIVN